MRAIFITALSLMLLACGGPQSTKVPMSAATDQSAQFEKLQTLAGTYLETGEDGARVKYEVISKGSALTETWHMASGKKELTVFHMDNGRLVATHYCAAGIQSTMQLAPQGHDSLEGDGLLDFKVRSTTNLPSPAASHNSGFGYDFSNTESVRRTETWTKGEETNVSEVTLQRLPS